MVQGDSLSKEAKDAEETCRGLRNDGETKSSSLVALLMHFS